MSEVIDVTRLHHKTVSEYQQHIVRKTYTRGTRNALRTVKVDLRVWRTAMRLAKGDSTRIVVLSPEEVLVVNQSKRKG